MRKISFSVLTLLIALVSVKSSAQVTLDAPGVSSLFLVSVHNAEAIRQGDLLVRETLLYDAVTGYGLVNRDGILMQSTGFYRVVFDFDTERFSIYSLESIEVTALDSQKKIKFYNSKEQPDGKYVGITLLGVCFNNDNQILAREFPARKYSRKRSEFSNDPTRFLQQIGFRDYRFPIGNLEGDPMTSHWKLKGFRRNATGDQLESYNFTADSQLDINIKSSPFNVMLPPGYQLDRLWSEFRFDLENGLVVKSQEGRVGMIDDKGNSDSCEYAPFSYAWTEINNIHVIKTIKRTRGENLSLYGDDSYFAPAERRLDFHWFSVNQPIDNKFFDGSILNSAETIKGVLDPKLNDAAELEILETKIKSNR